MDNEQEVKQAEPVEIEIQTNATQEKQDVEIHVTGFTLFGQLK